MFLRGGREPSPAGRDEPGIAIGRLSPELTRQLGRMEVELKGRVRFAMEGRTLTGTVTRTGPDGTLDLEGIRIEFADPTRPDRLEGEVDAARGRARLAGGQGGTALAPEESIRLEDARGTYFDPRSPEEPVRFRAAAAELQPRAQILRAAGASHVERGPLSLDGEGLDADLAKRSFSMERKVRFAQIDPAGRGLTASAEGPARAEIGDARSDGWRGAVFVLENAVRIEGGAPGDPFTGTGDRLTAVAEIPPRGTNLPGHPPGRIREISLLGHATVTGGFGGASAPRIDGWLDDAGEIRRLHGPDGSLLLLAPERAAVGGEAGPGLRLRAIESRGALDVERAAETPDRFEVVFAGPTLLHETEAVVPSYIAGPALARLERGRLIRLAAFGGTWLRFGGVATYAPAAEIVPDAEGFAISLGPAALVDARGVGAGSGPARGATFSTGGWAALRLPSGSGAAASADLPGGASVAFEGGGTLVAGHAEFHGGSRSEDRRVLARDGYRLDDPSRGLAASGEELEMEGEDSFKTSGKPARLERRADGSVFSVSAERVRADRASLRAEGAVEISLPAAWLSRSASGPRSDAPEPAHVRCGDLSATLGEGGAIARATLLGGVSIESAALSASGARAEIDRVSGRHLLLGGAGEAALTMRAPEGEFRGAAPEIAIDDAQGAVVFTPRGTLRFRPIPAGPRDPAEPAPVPVDLLFEGTLRFDVEKRRLHVEGKVHAESAGEIPWTLDAREFESRVEGGTAAFTARGEAHLVARDRLEARGDELRFDPKSGDVGAVGDPATIDVAGGQRLRFKRGTFNLRTGRLKGEQGAVTDPGRR